MDLIVMSSHNEGDLYKMVVGSVAERVLLGTKRPVLLIKPEKVPIAHHVDEQEAVGGDSQHKEFRLERSHSTPGYSSMMDELPLVS